MTDTQNILIIGSYNYIWNLYQEFTVHQTYKIQVSLFFFNSSKSSSLNTHVTDLDFPDLVGLELRCAVVMNNSYSTHELWEKPVDEMEKQLRFSTSADT